MMAKILSQIPTVTSGLWVARAVENGAESPRAGHVSMDSGCKFLENAVNYYFILSSAACFPERKRLMQSDPVLLLRFHLILCLMLTRLGNSSK